MFDTHLAFDVLTNSLFDSGVHKSYGEKIVDGRYSPPGMAAPLAIKDLLLALAEAGIHGRPMPAASSSMTGSSRWWLAGGPGSTRSALGLPWQSMQA